MGNHKKAALECEGPLWCEESSETENCEEKEKKTVGTIPGMIARKSTVWQADFNKTVWEPEWIFLRRPDNSRYPRKDGILRLYPFATTLFDKTGSPTFAAVKQPDFDCQVETSFHCFLSNVSTERRNP